MGILIWPGNENRRLVPDKTGFMTSTSAGDNRDGVSSVVLRVYDFVFLI